MQKESSSLVGLTDELKKQAGIALKSRADVDAYLAGHARAVRVPKHSPLWTSIKHGVLAVGLALAFFQYYMLGSRSAGPSRICNYRKGRTLPNTWMARAIASALKLAPVAVVTRIRREKESR